MATILLSGGGLTQTANPAIRCELLHSCASIARVEESITYTADEIVISWPWARHSAYPIQPVLHNSHPSSCTNKETIHVEAFPALRDCNGAGSNSDLHRVSWACSRAGAVASDGDRWRNWERNQYAARNQLSRGDLYRQLPERGYRHIDSFAGYWLRLWRMEQVYSSTG